jgi:S-formylglutathione hydrolase FrmB
MRDLNLVPAEWIKKLKLVLLSFSLFFLGINIYAQQDTSNLRFEISFPSKLQKQPVTGRIFLIIVAKDGIEPRLQMRSGPALFGVDINQLKPDVTIEINNDCPGSPVRSLRNLPAGDYYVQAVLNVYTEFHRSDGYTIWAHMDQWEGQKFYKSPGNLISDPVKISIEPGVSNSYKLSLTKVIPPVELPQNTSYLKYIKIKSELLSKFWGHPFYLGAAILLPKGYDTHPAVYYPVEYIQGHFSLDPVNGFSTENTPESEEDRQRRLRNYDETGYEYYQAWTSENFPRMICVTFQHPTPYYDDSYAVNSANNGPYDDAIMTELIPYIEKNFRIITEPYARAVTGGSTGGWETLALQIHHPDFFGGAWVFYPDPIDFRQYGIVNIYDDDNAFFLKNTWGSVERPMSRTSTGQTTETIREASYGESVLGSKDRSGEQLAIWEAAYGPVGEDGYPKPLWNPVTGKIDHSVSDYMRDHGYDLRCYLESNWSSLGPKLKGKLHFYCGDMDNLFLNLGVYLMEDFLKATKNPYYDGYFEYGRPLKGHGWHPMKNYELDQMIGQYILNNTPKEKLSVKWMYK